MHKNTEKYGRCSVYGEMMQTEERNCTLIHHVLRIPTHRVGMEWMVWFAHACEEEHSLRGRNVCIQCNDILYTRPHRHHIVCWFHFTNATKILWHRSVIYVLFLGLWWFHAIHGAFQTQCSITICVCEIHPMLHRPKQWLSILCDTRC